MPTSEVTFGHINDNIKQMIPILNGKPIEEIIATGIAIAYISQYAMLTADQFDEALRDTSVFISDRIDHYVSELPPTPTLQVN